MQVPLLNHSRQLLLLLMQTVIPFSSKFRDWTCRSHLLQADSDTLCNAWMRALQRTIHYLHENDDNILQTTVAKYSNDGTLTLEREPSALRETLLTELRRIPGNDKCADCGAASPKWASINLGVSRVIFYHLLKMVAVWRFAKVVW